MRSILLDPVVIGDRFYDPAPVSDLAEAARLLTFADMLPGGVQWVVTIDGNDSAVVSTEEAFDLIRAAL